MFRFLASILIVSFLFVCKAENSQKQSEELSDLRSRSAAAPMPSADEQPMQEAEKKLTGKAGEREEAPEDQIKTFATPKIGNLKIGRLLEYKVDLNFETKDFIAARKFLLELSGKYGFVQSESLQNWGGDTEPSMTAVIHVRSSDLYQVLMELEKVGTLTSENIQVEDHTENYTLEQIHSRREKIRIARRTELGSRSTPKNAAEIEELLGQSEDSADSAEFERWKILDRVNWAKISIHLYGPKKPKAVEVPNFGDAFIDLVSIGLKFALSLIYIIPPALIAFGIFYLFKYMKNRLK
ncbi:DUF4349 domain-containing protein [Leptospira wolffii]|uniref:DUF4349 domain-containing protein n=1 Tax=Leptospira wolffii TaxID=409998 RepID=UPI001082CEDB|nr:DUF4349 domain-containing protein [Leptospira wolffii]TGK64827.1 DUF4349 domain-containing protein [Leptospira wolffii]TGK76774.1 DUF4349 domain-containing protein [Leptospira wolffii]TGK77374.1 DUF4349 domain-containing protein [Leptospira wolffii]TGL26769.1 DUF4349 domain-containing protein [Leptospira wolffii]